MRKSLFGLALLASSLPCLARPPADQPMDASVLGEPQLAYSFKVRELDSADGQRHYRLWIGKPNTPPPPGGYPVAYLLDGNAAMGALDKPLLDQLAKGRPPVLVAVGYATTLRIDREGRTYDYTPGPLGRDPLTGLASGGADRFLDLLAQRVKPLVASEVKLDPTQQTLWGHSYGGLLVLHALLTRPGEYQTYAPASPSLWWNSTLMQSERAGFEQRMAPHTARLLLMRGEGELAAPMGVVSSPKAPSAATLALVASLQQVPGLATEFKAFPGLGHGPMLDASLRYLLQSISAR